jgi:hypothetical protein
MATKLKSVGDILDEMPTGLALLRQPFPPHQISKLPKPLAKREVMDQLPKAKCSECGGYHATSKIIHLDYVGHAALTDRLLDCDPNWSWEPMGTTPEGLPAINGGLWIKLTVCGVSRYGFGAADGKSGGDAVKEMIGDALRNAAMRFGAALDLWHKGDLHADEQDNPPNPTTGETPPAKRVELAGPYTSKTALQAAAKQFVMTLERMGDLDDFLAWQQTPEVVEFCVQLERDMPDWWRGGPSVPAEFVPLEIRIAQRKLDLEQIASLKERA